MRYRPYLKDTIAISEIGLGAWQLGHHSGWTNMTENEALRLVHQSIDFGINFFDTAPNYGHGTSEERLGKALKGMDRSRMVINTKFGHTVTGALNFSPDYIRTSLEGSLKRLQVDYVDSLMIHNPPSSYFDGHKNDHYEILETLIDEGKIKAYGASLDTCEDMKLLMETTNSKVIEAFFNIFHQDTRGGFDMAKDKAVAIIVKIPLDSGWLTGKYTAESRFDDIRSRWTKADIATRAALVDRLRAIVGPEKNLAQFAIAFCLAYEAVSTVIPGNTNLEQLSTNVRSADLTIAPDLIAKLEQLYQSEIKPLNLPW
ncbi:aldo/keto reductase [Aestuariivivens sediminis]|uniref:aldo/keto reductase n=1 Tax=Aestuariivivens sediminis TaxID=2913557 RepID=UPI001F5A0C00|nr:aldo/keto reductase [Aestuariivivens sediminis]